MAINRESANDVSFTLKIIRDNEEVQSRDDEDKVNDFVISCTITEGIDSAGIQAEIMLQDSADLISTLTGSETWKIEIQTGNSEAVYYFVAYNIDSRARSGQSEAYIIQCVSIEYMVNESVNIFGSSRKLFNSNTKSKDIVETLIERNLGTNKKVFAEDSQNDHQFIACNWRVFDTIYWVAQRSVRPSTSGTNSQNGYIFWENRMGYHFKSLDKIIEDVNSQDYDIKTDAGTGNARLYRYSYDQKKAGDEDSDNFKINSIVFPEDRNYLLALRNGSWSGYSVSLDPTILTNSKLSNEAPTAFSSHKYNIREVWNDMDHVKCNTSDGTRNPVEDFTEDVKQLIDRPKRIRYSWLPNRIFDQKGPTGTQDFKLYDEMPYLQAYQHLRVKSFKNVKLIVSIPGNVDLFSGYGLDVYIPKTKSNGDKIDPDQKYSGLYVIGGLRHKFSGTDQTLNTEVLLYRDSVPANPS
ncbi:hypothetical protein Syn7803C97_11 [Synechococcus phage S-MbCM6]|jgi:hypothetical protein|uniref:Uncharacterized protein n=3 Tax=Namakavirus smbcm6 TaxID=2734120 RepID=H8ZMB6_9CAUD|nr:tail protein [Synechococcus phage ACG-2014c]AHB80645.1 hypothetical protein S-MbCM25_010 [Synechococcus phage S-MbCM25]AFD02627.1 hypothetical protein [Synechococcus phage ACG-2014c]AIX14404.1 hypothetical protein Syn7803C43_9 [Synechococcus phage ACG-2014c]AIX22564.1 hypothetical protein Syn7803C97_11 [Synechococcus phage ACG-2014c]AIX22778.1 hypothetical protein Syn7803C98_10 [Synechococcus phage ACG-2014c]